MPVVIRDLTLLAIAVGAIAANALNIYSGAMSFLAAGIKIPFALRRAIVALGFGVLGFFIAWSALADAGTKYENFLLVIAYWIAPWLGIVLADRLLRRGTEIASLVPDTARSTATRPGVISLVVAGVRLDLAVLQPDASTPASSRRRRRDRRPHAARRLRARRRALLRAVPGVQAALGAPLADEPGRGRRRRRRGRRGVGTREREDLRFTTDAEKLAVASGGGGDRGRRGRHPDRGGALRRATAACSARGHNRRVQDGDAVHARARRTPSATPAGSAATATPTW